MLDVSQDTAWYGIYKLCLSSVKFPHTLFHDQRQVSVCLYGIVVHYICGASTLAEIDVLAKI